MSEIFIIRHGQASFGKENYDVLSGRGSEQSRIVAGFLYNRGCRFDAVYSGTLDRQRRTAEIFRNVYAEKGEALSALSIREGFDEYDSRRIIEAQIGEMMREDPSLEEDVKRIFSDRKSFQRVFEQAMLRWVSGKYRYEKLESWEDFQKRVTSALTGVMKENGRGRSAVIFASGGSLSACVQYALDISNEATMELCWQIVNTSVTRFRYRDGKITLSVFNDYSHLELEGMEGLVTYR